VADPIQPGRTPKIHRTLQDSIDLWSGIMEDTPAEMAGRSHQMYQMYLVEA